MMEKYGKLGEVIEEYGNNMENTSEKMGNYGKSWGFDVENMGTCGKSLWKTPEKICEIIDVQSENSW